MDNLTFPSEPFSVQPEAISVEEMRSFDRWAGEIGLSPLILMENAGRAVAWASKNFLPQGRRNQAAVFSGPGNNGGDGFVAARYLHNWRIKTDIFLLGEKEHLKKEAKINFKVLLNLKIKCLGLESQSIRQAVLAGLKGYDLIIDALLGTGLKKPVEGKLLEIIEAINQSGRPVVAVDIPSGMDGDSGEILGAAVRASETVTMAVPKKGFLNPQAKAYLGKVRIADLGIAYRKKRLK